MGKSAQYVWSLFALSKQAFPLRRMIAGGEEAGMRWGLRKKKGRALSSAEVQQGGGKHDVSPSDFELGIRWASFKKNRRFLNHNRYAPDA